MAPLETSRRLRKKNNTHKALLHAAKKLFEEKGLGNVTIDEISEAADVSQHFLHSLQFAGRPYGTNRGGRNQRPCFGL